MLSKIYVTRRGEASSFASAAGSASVRTVFRAILLLALAGCGAPEPAERESAISVTDPTGRTVTLHAPAQRVVSMMPSITEWVIAMGAADRLVARTDYDYQPALDTLPSVGGGLTPSIEWLAARQPDLVIAWPDAPSRSVVSRLEQVGIAVYTAPVQSIAEALTVATDLGTLLGKSAAAERAIADVRAGLDSVRAAVGERDRPEVLYLIGLEPLMAAGPGTFIDELITLAGGHNALHDLDTLWPQLSLEEVVRRAPDVVLMGSVRSGDPATLLGDRPGWRQIPAIRRGAVHAVDPDRVNRPGPHLHQTAAALASLIHGDDVTVAWTRDRRARR